MRSTTSKVVKTILWALSGLLLIGCLFLLKLTYIGTPGPATSLQFQGFIPLPKGSLLTVLDYLTIRDQSLYVTDESSGSVYKFDLSDAESPEDLDAEVFPGEPATHGVALDPTGQIAYVSRSEANVVDLFNPKTMLKLARIPVPDDPDGIFYDTAHSLVYVANGDAHMATLIDPGTARVVAKVDLGGKPEYSAVDPQTTLRYQNLRDTHSVVAVDLATRTATDRWSLTGCLEPSGMAIDAVIRRLFIVCAANAKLVVFDLNTHQVTNSVDIGGGPDSVAFDPSLHRLYTAGKSGVLTVITQDAPDSYRVLDSIPLHYGAHTLAIDPLTHRLYVGYASLFVHARVAVFTPKS